MVLNTAVPKLTNVCKDADSNFIPCYASAPLNIPGARVKIYDQKGTPGVLTDDVELMSSYTIFLMNGTFSQKIKAADVTTDSTGKKKVRVALEVLWADAQANKLPCDMGSDNDPTACHVTLAKGITVLETVATSQFKPAPMPSLGAKEIGNIFCDKVASGGTATQDVIDGEDFKRFKRSYGTNATDCPCSGPNKCGGKCYNAYADINGDGKVDGDDFKILKANYGKVIMSPPGAATNDGNGDPMCAPLD
jgi:hypothetical protein